MLLGLHLQISFIIAVNIFFVRCSLSCAITANLVGGIYMYIFFCGQYGWSASWALNLSGLASFAIKHNWPDIIVGLTPRISTHLITIEHFKYRWTFWVKLNMLNILSTIKHWTSNIKLQLNNYHHHLQLLKLNGCTFASGPYKYYWSEFRISYNSYKL